MVHGSMFMSGFYPQVFVCWTRSILLDHTEGENTMKDFTRASRNGWVIACCAISMFGFRSVAAAEIPEDYAKSVDVSGTVISIGSDTLANLMNFWSESFKKLHPNVTFQIEAKGSATAPPALTEGKSLLGPMSRAMKPEELDAFEAKHSFKPTRYDVALDCLAVWVNKDNPVKGFTLAQLDSIFSKSRKSGYEDVSTWGQAGVTDPAWADQPISLYGRNSESGTYAYFKEHAMGKGDFKDSVKQQPGSAGVVQAVGKDRQGVGYSGIGYRTSDVRAVPLAKTENDNPVEPTFENALNKSYPLGRTLYIYVAKKPGEPLTPVVREFIRFVLSKQGQEIVVKDGFGQLPKRTIEKNLKALD
jgi:phosphate transport system substrate-binding protein